MAGNEAHLEDFLQSFIVKLNDYIEDVFIFKSRNGIIEIAKNNLTIAIEISEIIFSKLLYQAQENVGKESIMALILQLMKDVEHPYKQMFMHHFSAHYILAFHGLTANQKSRIESHIKSFNKLQDWDHNLSDLMIKHMHSLETAPEKKKEPSNFTFSFSSNATDDDTLKKIGTATAEPWIPFQYNTGSSTGCSITDVFKSSTLIPPPGTNSTVSTSTALLLSPHQKLRARFDSDIETSCGGHGTTSGDGTSSSDGTSKSNYDGGVDCDFLSTAISGWNLKDTYEHYPQIPTGNRRQQWRPSPYHYSKAWGW